MQLLRRRLRDFIIKVEMAGDELQERDQRNAPVNIDGLNFSVPKGSAVINTLGMAIGNYSPVLFELVKQVSPLLSEKPEDILRFFVRMKYINWVWRKTVHSLRLCYRLCQLVSYSF